MTTDFSFSEAWSSSSILRFYTSTSGINFNFTEDGYTPPSGDIDFSFGSNTITISRLLFGVSNSFIAIWADPQASRTNGKFYVSTSDAFSIVEASDKSIYDVYTQEIFGRANEKLQSSGIVDLNIK